MNNSNKLRQMEALWLHDKPAQYRENNRLSLIFNKFSFFCTILVRIVKLARNISENYTFLYNLKVFLYLCVFDLNLYAFVICSNILKTGLNFTVVRYEYESVHKRPYCVIYKPIKV